MKIKANIIFPLMLLATMVLSGGCSRLSQVRPTSFALDSMSPRGLRSLSLDASVGVHNPASQIVLSEIFAEVTVSGKVIGNVAVDPVILAARTDSTYKIKADVTLAEGTSLMTLLAVAGKKSSLDDATADISAKVKVRGAAARKIRLKDIPLNELLQILK